MGGVAKGEVLREWRRGRWLGPVALVIGALAGCLGMVHLVRGDLLGLLWTGLGVGLMLQGWFVGGHRARATAEGVEVQVERRRHVVRWSDVIEVRPNVAAGWADHVVLQTRDGARHDLMTVPARDVDEVRALWRQHAPASA